MRAEYDSEADALSIDLIDVERYHGTVTIDDDYCSVALVEGDAAANVELLSPRAQLDLLSVVAERYRLDRAALEAAAQAALAAPDRTVELTVRALPAAA